MTDQIRVHTTHSVSYCDLPSDIVEYLDDVIATWELSRGERIGFDSVVEYFFERIESEGDAKYQAILEFMRKNDLEDSYNIDLDW
jgi:hypothetical protein